MVARRPRALVLTVAAVLASAACASGDEILPSTVTSASPSISSPSVTDPAATGAVTGATTPDNGAPADGPPRAEPVTPTLTPTADGPVRYRVDVVARHPHDETSWTQGLEFHDGLLLESTGRVGRSTLRLVEPETGRIDELVPVADDLFAEGVTVVDGTAIQITWKNETVLTTPLSDLDEATVTRRADAYDGEGWGLCYDGREIVMSDGSATLQFRDPATFELRRTVPVTLDDAPVALLNELECAAGTVWANVWLSTTIVAIDPATGTVTGVVDAADLVPDQHIGATDAVLNGIAVHPTTGRFWLTGKLWPVLYEVELVPDGS